MQVIRESNTPTWNYTATFPLDPDSPSLAIECLDMELLPPEDRLGSLALEVGRLLPGPGATWEGWMPMKEVGSSGLLGERAHTLTNTMQHKYHTIT